MNEKYSEELQVLYQAWQGAPAVAIEVAAMQASPKYCVIVNRWVGRHVKRSEYYFATDEIWRACFQYWLKRGGLVSLLMAEIKDEWGLTEEPYMAF